MTATPAYPLLRNPLAETLAAGGVGVALIVQKMQGVFQSLGIRDPTVQHTIQQALLQRKPTPKLVIKPLLSSSAV